MAKASSVPIRIRSLFPGVSGRVMRYLAAIAVLWLGLCMSQLAVLVDRDTFIFRPQPTTSVPVQSGSATLICTYWSCTQVFKSVYQDMRPEFLEQAECPMLATDTR